MRRTILSPVLPYAMYNFHLQIKPSIKDTYARRTTVSRIGFWYYYDSSETLLHERAYVFTGLDYWTGLLDSNFNALKTFYALYLPVELHNTLEQPERIAILLQRGTYLRSTIRDVASAVQHSSLPMQERYLRRDLKIYCCKGSVHDNYQSHNLIGFYHFWGISPRNSTLFTGPGGTRWLDTRICHDIPITQPLLTSRH